MFGNLRLTLCQILDLTFWLCIISHLLLLLTLLTCVQLVVRIDTRQQMSYLETCNRPRLFAGC